MTKTFAVLAVVATAVLGTTSTALAQDARRFETDFLAVKDSYMPNTWNEYVRTVQRGGRADGGPPPTDCPPAPKKECLESWGMVMPVNPFE
jgi:hypothetical protein